MGLQDRRQGGRRTAAAGVRIMALEPRLMFDGAAAATAAEAVHAPDHDAPQTSGPVERADVAMPVEARPVDSTANHGRKEVAFIDVSVPDYQSILQSIGAGVEVRLIGGNGEGLAEIARWAQSHTGYDAIHIIARGASGALKLGTDVVKEENVDSAAVRSELGVIGAALTGDGDILLYGCDVAAGQRGLDFVRHLSEITGADVAASTDRTGAAAAGGNWTLEASAGAIEAAAIAAQSWGGYLDAVHLVHNGVITSYVTIQDAVNASASGDTISVEAGTFVEQVTITRNINLVGAGRDQTVIRSPATADLTQSGGNWQNLKAQDIYAVVGVKTGGVGTTTIKDLTVDGFDQGYLTPTSVRNSDIANWAFDGIAALNSNVTVDNVKITRVREMAASYGDVLPAGYAPTDQPSGANHNEAILGESAAGAGQHLLTVRNSYIDKFQKTAILAWGPTLTVDINHNVIQGYGGTLWSTGNAIQIGSSDRSSMGGANGDRRGTTGSITDNQILDLGLIIPTPGNPGSYLNLGLLGPSGVLLYQAGPGVAIRGNTITGVNVPAWHNSATSNDGGFGNWGIDIVYSDSAVVTDNTISGFDVGLTEEAANGGSTMVISGNRMSNNGIDLWSSSGNDSYTLTSGAERICFLDSGNGVDTLTNFGFGDRIYLMSFQNNVVNGLLNGAPVIDFTGGSITMGDGTAVAARSVQLQVANGVTTLFIDTDGVQGAAEVQIKLNRVYSVANFALAGGEIRYVNTAPTAVGTISGANWGGSGGSLTVPETAFRDADPYDTLTYSATGQPSWMRFDPPTRTLSGVPPVGARGSAEVVITVSDGHGGTASQTIVMSWDSPTAAPPTKTMTTTTTTTQSFGAAFDPTPAPRPSNADTGRFGPKTGFDSTFSLAPSLTAPSTQAFQVVVAPRGIGGSDALVVNAPMRDAVITEGSRIAVTIPAEAFAHTRADATVTLVAQRVNGAPLPSWMSFNPRTGTFEGTPPPGFRGEVVVKVVARDNEGREAAQVFKIVVGERGQGNVAPQGEPNQGQGQPRPGASQRSDAAPRPAGRLSLTEQLRSMSQDGRAARQAGLFNGLKRTGTVA